MTGEGEKTPPMDASTVAEEGCEEYTGHVLVVLPGSTKPSTFKIDVAAHSRTEAVNRVEEEWKRVTDPREIRIAKKVTKGDD